MIVQAARMRDRGRVLSKYQRDRGWRDGEIRIVEERDHELHRIVRVARLRQGDRDMLPPLFDALVVAMSAGCWTITGFERVPEEAVGDLVAYQQSWMVMPHLYARQVG